MSQRNLSMHSEVSVEGEMGSGPSAERAGVGGKEVALVNVDPPTSTPSISHIGEPDGM